MGSGVRFGEATNSREGLIIYMCKSCKFALVGVALGAVAVTAVPAAAQEPPVELSAGYQFTRAGGDGESLNLPLGWYVDVAGNVTPMLKVVGEVSGAYKSESESFEGTSAEVSLDLHTFMGGVRLASNANPRVSPFGQILFGAGRAGGSFTASDDDTSISVGESATEFLMQLGGGVNAMVSDNFGIRVGADYRRILSGDGEHQFRVVGGVVIPFR